MVFVSNSTPSEQGHTDHSHQKRCRNADPIRPRSGTSRRRRGRCWCWGRCRSGCCGCGCGCRRLARIRIAIAIDVGWHDHVRIAGTQCRTARNGGRVRLVLGSVLREAVAVFHVAVEVEPTVGIAEAVEVEIKRKGFLGTWGS